MKRVICARITYRADASRLSINATGIEVLVVCQNSEKWHVICCRFGIDADGLVRTLFEMLVLCQTPEDTTD